MEPMMSILGLTKFCIKIMIILKISKKINCISHGTNDPMRAKFT